MELSLVQYDSPFKEDIEIIKFEPKRREIILLIVATEIVYI